MKKLLYIILFCIILSKTVFAESKVAIVGNSLAANLAYYNQVDISYDSCPWITNHAVTGDGLASYGLTEETVKFINIKESLSYPEGYGANRIKSFTEDCKNYDYMIFINGHNELKENKDGLSDYIKSLKNFLSTIRKNNPSIKIIAFPIYAPDWYEKINEVYNEYCCIIEDLPEYMEPIDYAHYSKNSNIRLFNRLNNKYHFF